MLKKFKTYFDEQRPAADYVGQKDDDAEVKDYKPRSKGEEDFKNKHAVKKTAHPVAKDNQFKSVKEETELKEGYFMVKFVNKDGGVKVREYEGQDRLDVESKAKVDAKRMGMTVASVREKMVEETEITEDVFADLKKIVEQKKTQRVQFANGRTEQVDVETAKAVLGLHKKVNEQNQQKIEKMIQSSPTNFMKVLELAIGKK